MAFASVGSLGSANSKTAGGTLSMSPSSAVSAGHLVAVFVAWEGDRGYTDAAGRMDNSVGCVDDAGNIYQQLQSGLYDVSDSMFLAYIDNPLSTSSVITVKHRSTALVARAMSAWEFTIGAGKRFAMWRDGSTHASAEATSGDPPSLSVSGLDSSIEYLFLHCLAAKRPSTDSYTWDSDYTQITSDGTTGGADNTNVTLRGGYRIASITSDTVDVTNNTASIAPDCWQGLVAVQEVDYDGLFPTFPNLDQFNRSDEDPLATPPWSSGSCIPGFSTAKLRVVSNQCAKSASGTGSGAQWWDTTIPAGDDGEAFVTIATEGTDPIGIHVFGSGCGNDATMGGYAVYWYAHSDTRPDRLSFGDSGNVLETNAATNVWAERNDGYKFGLQLRSSGVFLHLWIDDGSGWRRVGGVRKSSFVVNGGKFGLNIGGSTVARLDDFGGGTSIPFIPQIIRRVSG